MLTTDFVEALGKDNVQVYGKAAIVGVNGEYEHGAIWHEAALAFKAGGITEGRRVRQ